MLWETIFAARLSAIYRFTGEKAENFVERYEQLFSLYLDTDVLCGILSGKEEYQNACDLLQRAKKLAEAETDHESGEITQDRNLASVFSRLSLADERKDRKAFYHYRLQKLSPGNSFPTKEADRQGHQKLLEQLYEEMDTLAQQPPKDIQAFDICLDRTIYQYTWCISTSDYEGEDISLYDNLRVTEAIMACLLRAENKETPYTMVIGDFSGIQKYIFAVSSANHRSVAKRLRARSFYVDLVSKVFSQYIVDSFEVGRANILLQTGGKFYCMIPTMENAEQKLTDIRNAFSSHLYDTFHGTVSMNLAWMSFGDSGLMEYSDTVVAINQLLDEKKLKPFPNILQKAGQWEPEKFVLAGEDLKNKRTCKFCSIELVDAKNAEDGEECCEMCGQQIKIGGKLPKTNYLVYTRKPMKDSYPIFKDYYVCLQNEAADKNVFEKAYLIEALNRSELEENARKYPYIHKYMANHIPVQRTENRGVEVVTFDEIAASSAGMSKLGVLKADVDVLGFLFSQGLREADQHYGTISRVHTMSRMLEVFFSGYVEELLEEKEKYHNVYSVFSGGDDLFLLGPWDVMLDLAVEIRGKFKEFVADNQDVTLSAAVTVFHDKEHIAYMAEQSEEQLERAKNDILKMVYPDSRGRNAICVMGQLFSWEDFGEQLKNAGKIQQLVQSKSLDVGILRRVMQYSEMYRQFLVDGDVWKLMFEPLFYYDKKRNYRRNPKDAEQSWFQEQYVKSMENASDVNIVRKSLFFAETVITIALNKTRKERNR